MNNTSSINTTILILLGLLLIYLIFSNQSINTNIKEYNSKIDQIQLRIDSIQKSNIIIDDKILDLKDQFTILNKDITNVRSNITIIRKNTNEKTNFVDKYTVHELTKYFSDRYPSDSTGTNSQNGNQRSNKR